jgi:Tfp pilus assembly protein PilF
MNGTTAQPSLPRASMAPDDGGTLYVRGLLALRSGDARNAASLLTQALRRQPAHHGVRRNLVRALLVAERFEQVVTQANAALGFTPNDAELHFARGTALNALGHHAQACAAFARALSLDPDHAPSWLNMGNASMDLDDLTSAEPLYRTAIRLDATLPEAHASLGYVLTMQGRLPEAIEACEAAIRRRPDFAQAHWNLAIAALLSGDLPGGFMEYEWRKRHARYRADFPDLPGRPWDGTGASGQTILVRAEQGSGDVIQFARYLPLIREMGGNPVLACAASLVPLMQSMPGVRAVCASDNLPSYDSWIDQISLPLVFGTTLDTIPCANAYLFADPARARTWRDRLRAECHDGPRQDGQRKVGIAFAGNRQHPADRRRSIPADLDVKLPEIPGLSYVNLRHGGPAFSLGLPDLTPGMTDYAETAALIENLDLVVTVDTSVAHLAGALGKPVWILLPHAPDWRWMLGRSDSPWYPSVRLFRQPAAGDWTSVLAEVMQALTLSH